MIFMFSHDFALILDPLLMDFATIFTNKIADGHNRHAQNVTPRTWQICQPLQCFRQNSEYFLGFAKKTRTRTVPEKTEKLKNTIFVRSGLTIADAARQKRQWQSSAKICQNLTQRKTQVTACRK